jgi:Flp pilus assembly protein TadD
LSPKDFEAHNNLGILMMELEKIKEAELSFKNALFLKSDFVEAHNNLGISLKKQDKLQDAEESFFRVTALRPELAEAQRNLGASSNASGLALWLTK